MSGKASLNDLVERFSNAMQQYYDSRLVQDPSLCESEFFCHWNRPHASCVDALVDLSHKAIMGKVHSFTDSHCCIAFMLKLLDSCSV